jgi:hypothetical protein
MASTIYDYYPPSFTNTAGAQFVQHRQHTGLFFFDVGRTKYFQWFLEKVRIQKSKLQNHSFLYSANRLCGVQAREPQMMGEVILNIAKLIPYQRQVFSSHS